MMSRKPLKYLAAALLLPLVLCALAALYIAINGWNWARAPLQRMALTRTGRELVIAGDLQVHFAWPGLRVQAARVSFANPAWASEPQMLVADSVDLQLNLPALWQRALVLSEVRLSHPVVFVERTADGRKTWLLDTAQSDENTHVKISRLTLDKGRFGFDDAAQHTHIRAELDTPDAATGNIVFSASGSLKGQPLKASGQGGPVLTLRDERTPYPLKLQATVGSTAVRADGQVTGLISLVALDMQLAVRGENLALLFPLLGVGLPQTPAYSVNGRLVHNAKVWRYDKFTGRLGHSDVAGNVQVSLAGARPFLRGDMASEVFDIADLGPTVGVPPASAAASSPAPRRVLPDMPFKTERWRALDTDLTLRATRLVRAQALPLEHLTAHVQMQDGVLSVSPLALDIAGGRLQATLRLDGQQGEIKATAQGQLRQMKLDRLFPSLKSAGGSAASTSVGRIDGDFDLAGHGDSVGRMLATADGKLRLVAQKGEISRLLMEQMGLHVLEIVQLTLGGDQRTALHCAVADFGVQRGVMTARTLLLDTAVSTVLGSGKVDLAQETLDLTLVPHTRNTSLVSLRGPLHLKGSLAAPVVTLDKAAIFTRSAGAIALGLINPLLALLPLVDTGPGLEDTCGRPEQKPPGAGPAASKTRAERPATTQAPAERPVVATSPGRARPNPRPAP